MNKKTGFFLLQFIILLTGKVTSLELSNATSELSDKFLSFVDSHEGETGFRSLNIPSGGKAESLGTACTALAEDISFFDYNPAASCVLKNTEISVSHNSWISDSAIETLAGTIRFGNLGLGTQIKCFYVPFTEYNSFGDRVAGNYYSETTAAVNASYNFLSGYYFKGLALGSTFKAAWRSIPDYTDNDTDKIISGSGLAQSGAAFMLDAGMLVRFNFAKYYASRDPNFHFGISLLNFGTAFTGFGSGAVKSDDPLPSKISAGIFYRPIKRLAFTMDIKQPVNLQKFSNSEKWAAGAGVSLNCTQYFSVLAGFLIQGANPRISAGSEFFLGKAVMNINYTFDLTSSLNPVNHISLSLKAVLGDRGRAAKQASIDKYYGEGLKYYAHGDFSKAIDSWKKALELDKNFEPALEGLKAAQTSSELYRQIHDIQSLD